MIYIGLALAALLIGFIWWRYTSVARGAAARDAELLERLDPLAERLERGDQVDPAEVSRLAREWQYRPLLYTMLKHFERTDLFPADLTTLEEQGAGTLAYWLMHPNELQAPPHELALVTRLDRLQSGRPSTFLVYKYRMPADHWAGTDWLLGLAGPYFESDAPYSGSAGGFSRAGDRFGVVTPDELVDWYLNATERFRTA